MPITRFKGNQPVQNALSLGGMPVETKADLTSRMAIFLWGLAACGKTTFAATAPGDKLWLSFGDNEHVSVIRRRDVFVVRAYELGLDDLFKKAQNDNPFGLDQFLAENENITTVVVDSITAIAFRALQKAISSGIGASKMFRPSMEAPGISAYGGRNGIVLEVLTGLLRITAKHNVHLIVTAHEDDPVMMKGEQKELIDYITIMLGGKIVNNVSWRLSEIWHMKQIDTGPRERVLSIRANAKRRPMKTRIFSDRGEPSFSLTYDADKPDKGQMTIANWYQQWIDGGMEKLSIPNGRMK